jgi:hypothetical protein
VQTSPNAPRPIIVRSSKSSTPILCRCNRMYSVSLRSKSFKRFCSSSGETSASAIFRSRVHRLPNNHQSNSQLYLPYKKFELPMSMSNAPLFITTQENEDPQESSLTLGTSEANKKGLTDRLQSLILSAS